jgi:nitrite reductase (NO-forming)
VAAHRQNRQGLVQAAVFSLAAVVAVVVEHRTGFWLPLHLFVLGGLVTAISTTTQMLAVTWSSSPATPNWAATAQRSCLAVGTVAICAGRETDTVVLVDIGGTAVVASVVALIPILLAIRGGAITDRFTPAIDGYVAAMTLGSIGLAVAIMVATGRAPQHWGRLRDVHVTLNVFGLVGVVVAATLPYFSATQARRKMSSRATPAAIRIALAVLVLATTLAAVGRWFDGGALTSVGLVAYALGLAAIGAMLPIFGRRQLAWAGPRLVQLCAGLTWWCATTLMLAFVVASEGDERPVLLALVVGGFAQILASSFAYLAPVLRGGGHRRLTAGFEITRSWLSLVAGNVAAFAALFSLNEVLVVALLIWTVDTAIRGIRLVVSNRGVEQRVTGEYVH